MDPVRIPLPEALTFESITPFIQRLFRTPITDSYIIDGSQTKYFEPGGMLLCATALRRYIASVSRENHKPRIVYRGKENWYLSKMGFYQAFGYNRGERPGISIG